MKRFSLLLASTMLAVVSAFAQTKPTVTYTSFDEAYASDDAYYLYNVEAGLFLTKGNDWGTRASVASNGNTIVSYEDLTLGKAEVTGVPWYIGEATSINNTECYYFENKSGSGGVYNTADDWNDAGECTGIWVDGGSDRPWNMWYINKLDGNTFQLSYFITNKDEDGNADGTYSKPSGWYGAQKLADGDTRTYIMEGPNTTWAVVSASEFEKVLPQLNLYYVQVGLADLIAKGKALDLSVPAEYEALVNNAEAERAEVIAAINDISPRILLGEAIKAAKEVDPSYNNYAKFDSIYNGAESTEKELNDATALLKALTSLKKAINEALAKYPSLSSDLSEPTTVYESAKATLEEVQAAEAKVAEIVTTFEQSQATLDNPADVSGTIQHISDNLSATDFAAWTSTATSGNFQLNTWSVEGNPGNDGTNMTTPFIEYWKAAGNLLDDQKYYRDQEKSPFTVLPGAYRISANIRIYNESGAEYMTGAYLFGNANRTSLVNPDVEGSANAIEGAVYGSYNGMLYYWKDGFETYTIVPEDGTLKFGLQTESVNFNWLAAKGWKVEYLGKEYNALDHVRKNSELAVAEYGDETVVTKKLLADFNASKASYTNATSADEILAAYGTLLPLVEELPANIAAWQAYEELVATVMEHSILSGELSSEYIDRLEEYVATGNVEAPNGDNAFPNGSYAYIIKEMALSTKEVEAETQFLAELLDEAIKKSMVPGQDVSDMLKNPKFDDGFTGWTTNHSNVYKSTNGGVNNVEAYSTTVDIYQTVTDVPDGIYSITCQAFERPALNADSYDGTEEPKVFLFMNDFQTGVMHIAKDAQDPATAVSAVSGQVTVGANCFLNEDGEAAGWPYDLTFNGRYVPDSMEGASYAFQGGRYTQKVYGLVEGGTMKIGLTSNGVSAHWVLWANFKLTYEGKTEEALNDVIDAIAEKAETYMEENEENMTTPAFDALDTAIANALDAQDAGDVDEMWDALIALNKALSDAQANVAALNELKTAIDNMTDAVNTAENPSAKALAAYDEISAETEEDAILELTTEEVKALTEKVNYVTALLKIPAYEDASDDEPVDMTSVITNADFEQNSGATITGWTLSKENIQNATTKDSGINGKSTECWNNGVNGYWFNLSQTLTALPAGTYELSARAFNGQVANASNEGYAALYATTAGGKTASAKVDVTTESMSDAELMASAATYSIIFTIEDEEEVTIGFQSIGAMSAQWFMCDDFQLLYYGADSSKKNTEDEGLVVIDGIDAESPAISAIYTITGAKVSSLQKGINIVKYANGKVAKVLVK